MSNNLIPKQDGVGEMENIDLDIKVDVKIGLLHTVANAIYATPIGKIREAVANARDNQASWIIIAVDPMTKTLCIYDNGSGIAIHRFKQIFESIGYGLLSNEPGQYSSFFGLGLMSIFQLGKKITIFTKVKDDPNIISVDINAKEFFDPDNKDKSINELNKFVHLNTQADRKTSKSPLLDPFIEENLNGLPLSFTEIVVEDVNNDDFEEICFPGFLNELQKVLPLKVENDEPFLKRFTGTKINLIKELFVSQIFCPTIDVYFGIRGEGDDELGNLRQLWKYFPRFKSDIDFSDSNVYVDLDNGDFAYYIVHTNAVDLQRDKEEKEYGFWIRNQNYLVKAGDFLGGRKIIDQPLRNWIFGEIFHKDMNHFLTVSRTDFLIDKNEFKLFRADIAMITNPLNEILRGIWGMKHKIATEIIDPYKKINVSGGTLQSLENRLREMVGAPSEREFLEQIHQRLNEPTIRKITQEIEVQDARIDVLLQKTPGTIYLGKEDNLIVFIDSKVKENYEILWNREDDIVTISISPELFASKEVTFLGMRFNLCYVARKDTDIGFSINLNDRIIYINPFNETITQYSLSILDIYIALEIADAISDSKPDLKNNFLALIGKRRSIEYKKYITPLGDELRRTYAMSH